MAEKFDAIIVGAGQAGPSLAGRLAEAGQTVAVIERKLVGGTCVNSGCIPTKTLVASAHAAHLARRGAEYGIGTGEITVDMAKVKARKDKVMLDDRHGVESWLQGMEGGTFIRGHARFESPHTIRVDDRLLEADKIFLNVGGRAVVPDLPGLSDIDYMTNVGILELDTVPEHLVIIGGSYIALEFAQMYRRFGARITVIEKGPRLTSREDEDVSATIKEILEAEGIDVVLNATAIKFAKRDSGFQVVPREGAEPITGTHLLVAVGRQPNTDDLSLDMAGVETDGRGYIVVDDQLRTNVEHIWAMGDCNGRGAFTHTSYNDFEIVAANLLDNDPRRVSDRVPIRPLHRSAAGTRRHDGRPGAKIRPKSVDGQAAHDTGGARRRKGETQGFMQVVVDADTEEILGAAILGVGGDEVIHAILDIMTAKKPYTAISRTMHIHPTVSELVPTLLQEMKPLD